MIRIVSCVPSLTELIFHLSPEQLVGRTTFCIHPPEIKSVDKIGGTKNLNISKILSLQPDWVICTKEENEKEQVVELANSQNVLVFDIKNLNDALEAILKIGEISQSTSKAGQLIADIKNERALYKKASAKRAIYLIWQNPWMTVGNDTYIHHMMNEAGFDNVFSDTTRYPEIDLETEIGKRKPEVILLSSEPFPFKTRHSLDLSNRFPEINTLLVDGTYFSWYGSRIKEAYSYFSHHFSTLKPQSANNKFT